MPEKSYSMHHYDAISDIKTQKIQLLPTEASREVGALSTWG